MTAITVNTIGIINDTTKNFTVLCAKTLDINTISLISKLYIVSPNNKKCIFDIKLIKLSFVFNFNLTVKMYK